MPALQLNIDATAMTQAGVGGSYIESIVQQETVNHLQARGIDAQLPVAAVTRAYFNPNLEGIRFQAVMAVLQNVTMLSILLVGAAVIRERERGTIEHLLVMPIRASEIAAAKIWANGLVILIAAGLSLVLVVEHVLGGADRRIDSAVSGGHRRLSVRRDVARASARDDRQHHAAVRAAGDPGVSHSEHAVGRGVAAREHAGAAAGRDPGLARHALRAVSRSRCSIVRPASTWYGRSSSF